MQRNLRADLRWFYLCEASLSDQCMHMLNQLSASVAHTDPPPYPSLSQPLSSPLQGAPAPHPTTKIPSVSNEWSTDHSASASPPSFSLTDGLDDRTPAGKEYQGWSGGQDRDQVGHMLWSYVRVVGATGLGERLLALLMQATHRSKPDTDEVSFFIFSPSQSLASCSPPHTLV